MESLGFIGLGLMGQPIATNLIRAGLRVKLFSRSGVPTALIDEGGFACESIAEVSQDSEVVFIMVPDSSDVEAVLFSENGVLDNLSDGQTVVDLSSIDPIKTREFALQVESHGGMYLDAPVSGGDVGAAAGSLSIMVGGQASVFESIKPIFDLIGSNVTHVGANGDGQIAKLANQIIVAITIEAVAEALVFVKKMNADPNQIRRALMGGFASSRVLELHGERMINRQFNPGFRTSLHQKDLSTARKTAHNANVELPGVELTQQLFSESAALSDLDEDHSAIIKALESQSGQI